MTGVDVIDLAVLRRGIHDCQLELAVITRDGIYETGALRGLIYAALPDLYEVLEAMQRREWFTPPAETG